MKMWTDSSYPIILSCAKCLAPWVKNEVCELGYTPIDEAENIVVVEGSMRDASCTTTSRQSTGRT